MPTTQGLPSVLFGELLIGGTTDFDTNVAALRSIRAEWASATPVATRIDHLRGTLPGGLNGLNFLVRDTILPGTVHDDAAIDTFTNHFADDWLLLFPGDLRRTRVGIIN